MPDIIHNSSAELARLRGQVEYAISDQVTPMFEAARTELRHRTDRLAERIQDRPFTSIGIAAAVGFVVGALVAR